MENPYRLMTPGPVQVPPAVLEELSKPMIHHRTPEFEKILASVFKRLKKVFQTNQPVMIHPSTGSGAMESALVNTLSPGDKVVAVVSGKFGERWRDMAAAYGMNPVSLDVEWGTSVEPAQLAEVLKANQDAKAVLIQACETSTAVLHPIREVAAVVRAQSKALLMVDAITALGVMDLPMDEWGLDVVIGGSQKSFMIPAGLGFIALSKKAWEFNATAKCPRYYWDLKAELKANQNNQTRFSSPVNLIRALAVGVELMVHENSPDEGPTEGLKRNIRRFDRLARGLRKGGEKLGLKVYAKNPSPSVTAFLTPVDSEELREHLERGYNITVMGGQDKLKGQIIRIGTLGFIDDGDIEATLVALAGALSDLGAKADGRAAVAAYRAEIK